MLKTNYTKKMHSVLTLIICEVPSDWITGSNQKENFITIQELGINED